MTSFAVYLERGITDNLVRSNTKSSEREIAARYRTHVSFHHENERLAKSIPAPHASGLFHNLAHRHGGPRFQSDQI